MDTILQSEGAECGLASLAMIASHYGYKSDLTSLRNSFPQTLKGVNLQQLMAIADQLKLGSRALKLDMTHFKKLAVPCILHWDMNHFVVLEKIKNNSAIIRDPAIGKKHISLTQLAEHFTGVALELTPHADFEQGDFRKKPSILSMIHTTKGVSSFLIQLFALSFVLQLFALASPYYMQLVIDDVLLNQDMNLLKVLAVAFLTIALFNTFISALRQFVVIHLGATLNQQLAFHLFRYLLHLPLDFFQKRHMGDIISRFSSLQYLKQLITTSMVEAVIDGFMAITTLVLIYLYSTQLALIVTLVLFLYLIVRMCWYRPLHHYSEEAIVSRAKEQSQFMESIRGIQTIKLGGLEVKRQALWRNQYTEALNNEVKIDRLQTGYQFTNNLLFGIENVIVIYLAANLVMTNSGFTVGMLTAFIAYKTQLTQRFSSLVEKLIEYRLAKLHFQRLTDITHSDQEQLNIDGIKPVISGEIILTGVNFRYANSEPFVLQDLDLAINKGKSIAIVGDSGCGKSTLLKLIIGLLQPYSGKLNYDGLDTKQINQIKFREQIAAVMQDDKLLTGSIADNICQFEPQVDFEKVVEVAKKAEIHNDIINMPMNYNSLVGDMGATLSGGQKQRLLLARALYRDPKILFLDEATAHLDIGTEKIINQNLKQLKITRIMVAHRPQTIAMADHVYELSHGSLIQRR